MFEIVVFSSTKAIDEYHDTTSYSFSSSGNSTSSSEGTLRTRNTHPASLGFH